MRNVSFNKGQVVKYLAWTFGLAWAIQFAVAPLYRTNQALWARGWRAGGSRTWAGSRRSGKTSGPF